MDYNDKKSGAVKAVEKSLETLWIIFIIVFIITATSIVAEMIANRVRIGQKNKYQAMILQEEAADGYSEEEIAKYTEYRNSTYKIAKMNKQINVPEEVDWFLMDVTFKVVNRKIGPYDNVLRYDPFESAERNDGMALVTFDPYTRVWKSNETYNNEPPRNDDMFSENYVTDRTISFSKSYVNATISNYYTMLPPGVYEMCTSAESKKNPRNATYHFYKAEPLSYGEMDANPEIMELYKAQNVNSPDELLFNEETRPLFRLTELDMSPTFLEKFFFR